MSGGKERAKGEPKQGEPTPAPEAISEKVNARKEFSYLAQSFRDAAHDPAKIMELADSMHELAQGLPADGHAVRVKKIAPDARETPDQVPEKTETGDQGDPES